MPKKLPSIAGDGMLAIWSDLDLQQEDQFDTWHIHEHLVERVNISGFLRARRYVRNEPISDKRAELLTLYETEDVAVMASEPYLERLQDPTPLTQATVPLMERMRRSALRKIASAGQGIGGHLSVSQFRHSASDYQADSLEVLLAEAIDPVGVVAAHVLAPEVEATKAKDDTTEGKATRTVADLPQWLLMIEALHERALMEAQSGVAQDLAQVAEAGEVAVEHYRLAVLLEGPP